ncbi:MAG: MraY family glycosyltransferase [Patescibacteria group bacterium]|nr:MraY family glycosyltransferase [Patescibacteria group bacterium]
MIYLIAGFLAFLIALALYPLSKTWGKRFNILDHPAKRKVHKSAIPRTGGIVFFVAFWSVVLIFHYFIPNIFPALLAFKIFLGSVIIFALGFLDDKYGLSPYIRLIAQVTVALLVAYLGIRIDTINIPFYAMIHLEGFWSYSLTILWIVMLINIVNWLDGLDGLASGVSIIAFLAIIYTAFLPWVSALNAALFASVAVGLLLAFMPYNFLKGNLFMGDSGSNFLGYILAITSMLGAAKLATSFLVLGLPILDGAWVILYRLRQKQNIFMADKNHFHHRLLRIGLDKKQAVIVFWLFSLVFGLLVITASTQLKLYGLVALVIICLGFFIFLDIKEKKTNC